MKMMWVIVVMLAGSAWAKDDWLVSGVERPATVAQGEHPDEVVMTNGLIRRVWRVRPNAATVALDNLMTGESIIRGVKPEAVLASFGVATRPFVRNCRKSTS